MSATCSTRWLWRGRCTRASATAWTRSASATAVDNSQRDLHGALLDAELLLDVYLAMTGGQGALTLEIRATAEGTRPASTRRAHAARARCSSRRATRRRRGARAVLLAVLDKASGGKRGRVWPADRRPAGQRRCMSHTLPQAFGRGFLGNAPAWYKLTHRRVSGR